jgi:hypothetical protein
VEAFSCIYCPSPPLSLQDYFFRGVACIIARPMPNSHRRGRRRRAQASDDGRLARPVRDERGLLEQILSTPDVALVVPRLQPEVLHKVIQTCGLEDCGDLVALATPQQLQRVFDLDLWRASRPGLDDRFDADRFGTWLEVLMESGASTAAHKVAALDADLVIGALAQHVRVFDSAAVSSYQTLDGEIIERRRASDEPTCDVGGYRLEATRTGSWDSIIALLLALDEEHADYFHRVMRACVRLSNSGFELDGLDDLLDDRAQDMFDLSVDRDQRREKQGYVTPAQARAFLHSARRILLEETVAPAASPLARAYFREVEPFVPSEPEVGSPAGLLNSASESEPPDLSDRVASIVDVLRDAGVLTPPPRALLGAGAEDEKAPALPRIQAFLQAALDLDPVTYSQRTEELAYLANVLVAGCSIQTRRFTEREASDAAIAICNLGLENWPDHWALAEQDLVRVFQVGWTILYTKVCLFATDRLLDVLAELRCSDRAIQSSLNEIRIDLMKQHHIGTPWGAREHLDGLAMLDLTAWAAILGLIDELPVMPAAILATTAAGMRSFDASAFTFISENSQIASIREFMRTLPDLLRG